MPQGKALGMPLYGIYPFLRAMYGFYPAIYSIGSKLKAFCNTLNPLVVSTIDRKIVPIQLKKKTVSGHSHLMYLIPCVLLPAVSGSGGKVLYQSAAKSYVQQLHTAADAKYWPPQLTKFPGKGHLSQVQLPVDSMAAKVLRAVETGINIGAAWQEKGVAYGRVAGI